MSVVRLLILAGLLCLIGAPSYAELDEPTRQTAINAAFGIGCSVQAKDITRANAWAQYMMGHISALASNNLTSASEFAAYINSTTERAASEGGFNCDGFPKLP